MQAVDIIAAGEGNCKQKMTNLQTGTGCHFLLPRAQLCGTLPLVITMIRIQNLSLPLLYGEETLKRKAAKALGVSPGSLGEVRLLHLSVDARKKSNVHYVCSLGVTVADEVGLLRRLHDTSITPYEPAQYIFPPVRRTSPQKPVVVGMGPAGLFAALFLARNGIPSLVLERGRSVEERTGDVEHFWHTGQLSTTSNVQFGEGGAGTFSDGKLNTGTHDPRISAVLSEFVRHGAPEDILYQKKPHVGTDLLQGVVKSIRQELIALGCEIRFEHQLYALRTDGCRLTGITVMTETGPYDLDCDALVLAPGHSARDTFRILYDTGISMEAKAFAIGCRIEHPQELISKSQYGPAWDKLPPADYKLSCHLPTGRSAFTFCVCPGGQVVAAASGYGQVVTNGMSLRSRDGENINGGFLVGVSPADFGPGVLDGIAFQERWEQAAWALGSDGAPPVFDGHRPVFHAPVQSVADFLAGRPSKRLTGIGPTYRPGVTPASLDDCLPDYVSHTLRSALPLLEGKLHGFADGGALLTGVETRSSSPVRILRDDTFQASLRGLFPCGEGAGYAGGITSAAVDGIRVAEAVAGLA